MHRFRWLDPDPLPPTCDLRQRGWELCERSNGAAEEAILLASWPSQLGHPSPAAASTLLIGVGDGAERARLLGSGYGDVLGPEPNLDELAQRAARLVSHGACEPRQRHHEELAVDLLAREAFRAGRPLGLHPREFDLLWRLMAAPEVTVTKAQLLRDVWRLNHEPETNSLAVHASRLRGKLRAAGIRDIIETRPTGYAYRPPLHGTSLLSVAPSEPLDAYTRLTDDRAEAAKVNT